MEKLTLALVHAAKKLRPHFQSHQIKVLTDSPLRQVLLKHETSGRLIKWAIELRKQDIEYCPRKVIKGQALANFLIETPSTEEESITANDPPITEEDPPDVLKVYVDGSHQWPHTLARC